MDTMKSVSNPEGYLFTRKLIPSLSTPGSRSTGSDPVATPQTQKRCTAHSVEIHQREAGSEEAQPVLDKDWLYEQSEVIKILENSERCHGNEVVHPS